MTRESWASQDARTSAAIVSRSSALFWRILRAESLFVTRLHQQSSHRYSAAEKMYHNIMAFGHVLLTNLIDAACHSINLGCAH